MQPRYSSLRRIQSFLPPIGSRRLPNNLPATSAYLFYATSIALDSAGNFYFSTAYVSDPWENGVWNVTKSTGSWRSSREAIAYVIPGDGGPPVDAQLSGLAGVAGTSYLLEKANLHGVWVLGEAK